MNFEFLWLRVSNVFISSVDCQSLLLSSLLSPKGMNTWITSGVMFQTEQRVWGGKNILWMPPRGSLSVRTPSNSWHVPTQTFSLSLVPPALSSDILWHPRVIPTPRDPPTPVVMATIPLPNLSSITVFVSSQLAWRRTRWLWPSVSTLFWPHARSGPSFCSSGSMPSSFSSLLSLLFWNNHIPTESGKTCSERFHDP